MLTIPFLSRCLTMGMPISLLLVAVSAEATVIRAPCHTFHVALEKRVQDVLGKGRKGRATFEQLAEGLSEAEQRRLYLNLKQLPPYRLIESDILSILGFANPFNWHRVTFGRVNRTLRVEILEALAKNSRSKLMDKALAEEPMTRGEMAALILMVGQRWGMVQRVKRVKIGLNWISRADPTGLATWLYRNREVKLGETQLQHILRQTGMTSRGILQRVPYELDTLASILNNLDMSTRRQAFRSIYAEMARLKAQYDGLKQEGTASQGELSQLEYRYKVLGQLYVRLETKAREGDTDYLKDNWEAGLPQPVKNWWRTYFLPDAASQLKGHVLAGIVVLGVAFAAKYSLDRITTTSLEVPYPTEYVGIADPVNENTIPPGPGEALGPLELRALEIQLLQEKYDEGDLSYNAYFKTLQEIHERYKKMEKDDEGLTELPNPPP